MPLQRRLPKVGFTSRLKKYSAEVRLSELNLIDSEVIDLQALPSQAVGIAQASLDAAVKYSKERKAFDQPLSNLQAIQFKIADMATDIEAARSLTLRAAAAKDSGERFTQHAAMAKLFASKVAVNCALEAIQIHGGYGYIREYNVERYLRDAKITEIYEGTSEIQRIVIARSLLQ